MATIAKNRFVVFVLNYDASILPIRIINELANLNIFFTMKHFLKGFVYYCRFLSFPVFIFKFLFAQMAKLSTNKDSYFSISLRLSTSLHQTYFGLNKQTFNVCTTFCYQGMYICINLIKCFIFRRSK